MNEYAIFIRGDEQHVLDMLTEITLGTSSEEIIQQCEEIRHGILLNEGMGKAAGKDTGGREVSALEQAGQDRGSTCIQEADPGN